MRHFVTAGLFVALAAVPAVSPAKDQPKPPTPAVVNRVVNCTTVTDPQARLACYDREVAAMNQAEKSGELVAMDRAQVRKTKRSLFGLALPDLGVFGDASEDESTIETTIRTVRMNPDGKYLFDLAEAGRWLQLDSRNFVIDPKAGQPIRIRRAAMGSYLANVNKQVAIRVRRVQ
jgi:hypothetical protein